MIVFGYDFPHWKTNTGLLNLCANGFKPDLVILQGLKPLNIPVSKYRITPVGEYLSEPRSVCRALGIDYIVQDHDTIEEGGDLGVILGARILKKKTIELFTTGILNIHPGILPGNRGLDNLKHSLVKKLPIGVTAHMIDHRIDMGIIIKTQTVPVYDDDSIRDIYNRQRNAEQQVLIDVLRKGVFNGKECEPSEKFTVVEPLDGIMIRAYLHEYKKQVKAI